MKVEQSSVSSSCILQHIPPLSKSMPAIRSLLIIVVAIFFVSNELYSQSISGNSRFARQLDAVSWNFNTNVDFEQSALNLQLENNFNTRLFLFNGLAQNVQDEHSARLRFALALHPQFGVTASARTFTFTNTNLRQDAALAGVYITPYNLFRINPMIGIMRDERSDQRDEGFTWALNIDTEAISVGEASFKPAVSAEVAYIDPRRLQTFRYGTQATYSSDDQFNLSSEIWLGNARRDSYQSSSLLNRTESNFIESIESDTAMVALFIETPIAENLLANIDIEALNNVRRNINTPLDASGSIDLYDSRSLRQFLDVGMSVTYPARQFRLQAGSRWSFQVRESQLINTDGLPPDQVRRRSEILENSNFNQRRFEMFSNNMFQVSERYSVTLSGSASILRYDTPEMNNDDRDELSFFVRNTHRYDISEDLRASLILAGEAFHYVYLFSERSIENNWRRSLRLIPEITWQPSPTFYMQNQFMVRANYTVDDYEIPGRQKNDQSAREMAGSTTISWTFAPEWNIETNASRSELRIGRLFWETFQETPIDTIITWDVQTMLSKRFGDIIVSSGVRYFRKFDFLQQASIQIEVDENGSTTRLTRLSTGNQITTQWGPAVMIRLPLSSRNELYINGWYQVQKTRQRLYIEYPEPYRADFLRAENQAVRRVFPNMEITARFRF